MYVMFDSVTLGDIPTSAQAVAGYTSGNWPTYDQVVRDWPHAKHLSIAVGASHDADCLDVESGDATPAEAPAWFRRQRARGLAKPVLYCSQSVVPSLVGVMNGAGIPRSEYRLWSAHYTGVPHICGRHEGLPVDCDATQWTDRALGRNLDESLCASDFFRPAVVANPLDVLLEPERRLVNSFDHYIKHPHLHEHGLAVTRAGMVHLRKVIWVAAERGRDPHGAPTPRGWGIRDRAERYRLLMDRTKGLG